MGISPQTSPESSELSPSFIFEISGKKCLGGWNFAFNGLFLYSAREPVGCGDPNNTPL